MSDFTVFEVQRSDTAMLRRIDSLLQAEGIRRDKNLDYTCAMVDSDYNVIATGSSFGNTLRCFAVSHEHQGEGLLNEIVSHLMEYQLSRGNTRIFIYTKAGSARFFSSLGFYEIARVNNKLVFMENRRTGFKGYLDDLALTKREGVSGAVVMNANPFTLGHEYLVETASKCCDTLHLFVLSEDASLVPFAVRKRLVELGTDHLPNVIIHDSGPYIISNATFPSYFLKDDTAVIDSHARLDLEVFSKIAETLNVSVRFVGEEPLSQVTGIYNAVMAETLPRAGLQCRTIPRLKVNGAPVSASDARTAIKEGDWERLKSLVPKSTFDYFISDEAAPVVSRIRRADNVVHY